MKLRKSMPEGIAVEELCREVLGSSLSVGMCVDASAWKEMLLRTGAGRMTHFSTKQLWLQWVAPAYGTAARKRYAEKTMRGRSFQRVEWSSRHSAETCCTFIHP